ncbi:MAG: DNA polymerase III subunit delta' [Pseudomonadota bacterium]|nr:DNA polymerase III subunit delta' [Pseudomonadota bacterium]
MGAPYPWQAAQWAQCQQRFHTGTLPHALLLSGQNGLGKLEFARWFARFLLCKSPGEMACGHCRACHLLSVGNHPDYLETTPEETNQQIKVDQIRELNYFIGLTRSLSCYKVALVVSPEQMNRNAANSLLKTLEEPPAFTLIMLITAQRASLPATVISRCQQIAFNIPPRDIGAAWLKRQVPAGDADALLALSHGAPLRALEMSAGDWLDARRLVCKDATRLANALESPITVAERWRQYAPQLLLEWLLSWLTDMIKLCLSGAFNCLDNPDIDRGLRALAERIDSEVLFALYDTVLYHRRLQHASLNQQLVIDEIALAWAAAFKSRRGHYNDGY